MATAKQLAALKKARAARKKNLAAASKKRSTTKRKAPAKRKVATKKPARKKVSNYGGYVIYVNNDRKRYYFTGKAFDDEISKARTYSNGYLADAAMQMAKTLGLDVKKAKKS